MKAYDHTKIERKWQRRWAAQKLYATTNGTKKPKYYVLDMFPYPSGEGLHVGHPKGYIGTDVLSRYKRMSGFDVLHPMGWDAFGLPAENFALKHKVHPAAAVTKNIKRYKEQLSLIGFDYDWSREITTTDPAYYKWTQWIFLQLFKQGLATESFEPINWCPSCQTGLANEDLEDGRCERCGSEVEKKPMRQWVLRITQYADRLLKDLEKLEWPESIKESQRNWIGRSEGAAFTFALEPDAEPTFYQFSEPGKIRADQPFVERPIIFAIIKHWKEEKYLGLRWKKVNWETFVTGGIEKGQTPEDAVRAEILEETGYTNIKRIQPLGRVHSKFFHPPKQENRYAHAEIFYVELKDGNREELSAEEQANHEPVWLTAKEIEQFNLPASHRYAWERLRQGVAALKKTVTVFTTRADTLFGATYLVLAPEHPLVSSFIHQASNAAEIDAYVKAASKASEADRTAATREKTGVELKGVHALHPATGQRLPVWISDYVLGSYGTGAVMGVPAHDERDGAFAKTYGLERIDVVIPSLVHEANPPQAGKPDTFRHIILAILYDPKREKYLVLKWKHHPWTAFITGGVEAGEDRVTAAQREITEETGYTNVKLVRSLGLTEAFFYAAHKGVNRQTHAEHFLFELLDDTQIPVNQDEQDAYDLAWLTAAELARVNLQHAEAAILLERLRTGEITHTGPGVLINSGQFDGMTSDAARAAITKAYGRKTVQYKLKDWVFSRQRYWGEPIPIIHCDRCGVVPVPEKDLPVTLPAVKAYAPSGTGESPLATITTWVRTTCPRCGGPGRRETNTMPQWAGSSWYYLRYIDPTNTRALVNPKKERRWQPVDMYVGGTEHATRHLIYARFWHKFLYDLGVVSGKEPFRQLKNQGLIAGPDGRKMSKRFGNVINPDDVVATYGADTFRLYEMFMGPFDAGGIWNPDSIIGCRRFLEKVWRLVGEKDETGKLGSETATLLEKTIKKVTEDIAGMSFNTAIAALMTLVNELEREPTVPAPAKRTLLLLLAPFAPHLTEELWASSGGKGSVHVAAWPRWNPKNIKETKVKIVVQVDGKVRATITVPAGTTPDDIAALARAERGVATRLADRSIQRVVHVPGRLVNFVLGDS